MEQITITEALAEIKLIVKKVEKKRAQMMPSLATYDHVPDPYQSAGGYKKVIDSELQSINDLSERLVRRRARIAETNATTDLTIEGRTRKISEWLAYKRECQNKFIDHNQAMMNSANHSLKQFEQKPQLFKQNEGAEYQLAKLSLNVDLSALAKNQEYLITIKEKLDGALSLKNATILISI